MARIVMKFGGTSVANLDRIQNVANHVKREFDAGHQVAVVLSAMHDETNRLVALSMAASPLHDAREYDTIISTGEQVAVGLLAITLQSMGIAARSWLGWQLPIKTTGDHSIARIEAISGELLIDRMTTGQVAVIAGFQGIAPDNRITTLGRGGSDTTAVALAVAVNADRCDIYTDVDGVYTTDPRIEQSAQRIPKISYEEMLEMASLGAKVLHPRSVGIARQYNMPVLVRSSFEPPNAIQPDIASETLLSGTLVTKEENIMEQSIVSGVTYSKNEAKITLRALEDRVGVAASIFDALTQARVNVDMIVQNISDESDTIDMTFTVSKDDYPRVTSIVEKNRDRIPYKEINTSTNVGKISVIGVGMTSNSGVAAIMFRALAEKGINIQLITTSEIKISVLIDVAYTELAVRALHQAYELDG